MSTTHLSRKADWPARPELPTSLSSQVSKPKGSYVLIMHSQVERNLVIGRWGVLGIRPGYYLYVGSAFGPGGLAARVGRHCRRLASGKRPHWHIDHLLEFVELNAIWFSVKPDRLEHKLARALQNAPGCLPVEKFGSSDCDCHTHLFHSRARPTLALFPAENRFALQASDCAGLAQDLSWGSAY